MEMEVLLALIFLSMTAHSINNTDFRAGPRTFRVPRKHNLNVMDGISGDTSNHEISEQGAAEPSNRRGSKSSSGRRPSEPSSGHRASNPVSDHGISKPNDHNTKLNNPAFINNSNLSVTVGPKTFRLFHGVTETLHLDVMNGISENISNHDTSESTLLRRILKPSSGKGASKPSSGLRPSDPSSGHRASEPSSGLRPSEPSSGLRPSEPSSGLRPSEPSSGHRAPDPVSGHGISKPASNYIHNAELNKPSFINNSTWSYFRSSTSTKLIPAIYIIVILIGIPSNVIVLKMLFSRVRTVSTAIFYTNLAISDVLFCLMLPFKAAYHLNGNNWIFGETMCRIMTIFFYGNMYCSILLLMCISISRYIAIVHPFKYRSLPKQTCTILMCTIVWITVLMFMIPFFINRQTYNLQNPPIITCNDLYETSADTFQFFYFISLAVFGYLIPFSVITFCYFSIIRTLGSPDQKWYLYLKITILLLVIFALCFTPSNIILIIHQVRYHYTKLDDMYGSYLIALCFSSLNSCLDPFLYFLMSEMTKPSSKYGKIKKLPNETHKMLLASELHGSA